MSLDDSYLVIAFDEAGRARSIRIPMAALRWRAVRASGPGGQNVNKVATKVELRVALADIEGLTATRRQRLVAGAGAWLIGGEELRVTSARTRVVPRNLEDARNKLAESLRRALYEPRRRRATKPTRSSVRRRLTQKRHQSDKKRYRRGPGSDD